MRGIKAALLVVVSALMGSAGVVGVGSVSAAPTPVALLTLTTIPNAWQHPGELRPQLEVFADGRAVKSSETVAAQRVDGRIPADVLAAAVVETKSLATVDFGTPKVTDQGSQIIDLMPSGTDQDVHLVVYAPEFTEDLAPEQLAARKRFADLYRTLLNAFAAD